MLVTVEKVKNVVDNGFDKVEVCEIDGQSVVVGKGEFKDGDLCVYFRAGTLIPHPFIKSRYIKKYASIVRHKTGESSFRIKSKKFRNGDVVAESNGVAFTLRQFYSMMRALNISAVLTSSDGRLSRKKYHARERDDLSELVGAMQYRQKTRYITKAPELIVLGTL